MRSLFVNPQIDSVFLLYRIGVFAACAATIIAASALIWLTHLMIRNPFVTLKGVKASQSADAGEGKV
jgi:hypothetical protein